MIKKKKFNNNFFKKSFKPLFQHTNKVVGKFNFKQFGGKKDWDGDGVPNWKDCQPFNTMRQHRYTKITKEKDRTLYENPEGKKIYIYGRKQFKGVPPTVDDVAYVFDESPRGYHPQKTDVMVMPRKQFAKDLMKIPVWRKVHGVETKGEEKAIEQAEKSERFVSGRYSGAVDKEERPQIIAYSKRKSVFGNSNEKLKPRGYQRQREIIIHEIGHAKEKEYPEMTKEWDFPIITSVSPYGRAKAGSKYMHEKEDSSEDIAESFTVWHKQKESDIFEPGDYEYDTRMNMLEKHMGGEKAEYTAREREEIEISPQTLAAEGALEAYRKGINVPIETMTGDDDGDGVMNATDCAVDDPGRQEPRYKKESYNIQKKYPIFINKLKKHIGRDEEINYGYNKNPNMIKKDEIPKEIIDYNQKLLKSKYPNENIVLYKGIDERFEKNKANKIIDDMKKDEEGVESFTEYYDVAKENFATTDGRVVEVEVPVKSVLLSHRSLPIFHSETKDMGIGDERGEGEVIVDKSKIKNLKYKLLDDDDGDGVDNVMDCDPNDPTKQGPEEYIDDEVNDLFEKNIGILRGEKDIDINIGSEEYRDKIIKRREAQDRAAEQREKEGKTIRQEFKRFSTKEKRAKEREKIINANIEKSERYIAFREVIEAKRKIANKMYGDDDDDGVMNATDCAVDDPERQGPEQKLTKEEFELLKKVNPELAKQILIKSQKQKEYMKEYRQRPEAKERKIEYQKKYQQKPEAKERKIEYQKKYQQKPEVKEKRREHEKEYYQKPEVKERKIEYMKEYYQRPEVKEKKIQYTKEYYQRPEVKEKRREYYQRPEVKEKKIEYQKEYYHRPEVKEKILEYQKEYYKRPEVKEKILERQKEYEQRPEVKEKRREHQKEYYQRPEVKERIKIEYLAKKEAEKEIKETQEEVVQDILKQEQKEYDVTYNNIYGDDDGDEVNNLLDCDPDDPTKQGYIHNNKAVLYHGTSVDNLKTIKKQGLKPQHTMYSKPTVFLTPSYQHAIYHAKKGNKKPVVLEVSVPIEETGLSREQILREDHPTREVKIGRNISPQYIKVSKQLTKDTDKDGVVDYMDCQPRNYYKQEPQFDDNDDETYEERIERYRKGSEEFKRKSEEKKQRYQEMFSELDTDDMDELAYGALRLSAEEYRQQNPIQEKEKRVYQLKKVFTENPVAHIGIVEDKGKIKKGPGIYLDEEDSSDVARELDREMSSMFIRTEAEEQLAYQIYGKPYYDLTTNEKRRIQYYIKKQIPK